MIEKNLRIRGANLEIADAAIADITPGASTDLEVNLSDNAGARAVVVKDSDGVQVCKIDSNGLVTSAAGLAGPVTGALIGNITPSGADVSIVAASGKDVIAKLGDAEGAKKLIIKDSANAEQASINSDGLLTAKSIAGNMLFATSDTNGAPTNNEMISAFGAVANAAGAIGVYLDSHASGKTYFCICDGVKWHTIEATVGA